MTEINFRSAEYLVSAPSIKECPSENGVEVAFAGRSNAGKSSAINALTGNKKLARTSKTPGRTQLINFFAIENNEAVRLVDLPGYGYAKVPLGMKKKWQANLSKYLAERQALQGLVLMMDIRHPLQDFDTMMLKWAIEAEMPTHILLTKADKLKKGAASKSLMEVQQFLQQHSVQDLVSVQMFSSLKKTGLETLREQLNFWLEYDEAAINNDQLEEGAMEQAEFSEIPTERFSGLESEDPLDSEYYEALPEKETTQSVEDKPQQSEKTKTGNPKRRIF